MTVPSGAVATINSVMLTAHFESSLESIETLRADAPHEFDALLGELVDIVIPNIQSFPDMVRLLLQRPGQSVEAVKGVNRLSSQLTTLFQDGEIREYEMRDCFLLYARTLGTIFLLSIRHKRQLSFDFTGHWTV